MLNIHLFHMRLNSSVFISGPKFSFELNETFKNLSIIQIDVYCMQDEGNLSTET